MIKYTMLRKIVKTFEPTLFMAAQGLLRTIELCPLPKTVMDEEIRVNGLQIFKGFEEQCRSLGLDLSAMSCQKLVRAYSKIGLRYADVVDLSEELRTRLIDEMGTRKFFFIRLNMQEFATNTKLFGEDVSVAFPSTLVDIEEAAKCIAFERWTAAVFHLSRVSEIATVLIGKKAEYNDPKPSLSGVLNYIDGQLEKSRKNRKEASNILVGEIEFFSNLSAQMHAVNQAWRQHVAHLDTKYTEEEALRIWDATKGLLQAMSVKVKEPIK